ncbi:GAF and ANTAR domain-containing protein [Kribbella qitaiheensis]|uniref:GAF and ANTAR domain-containing protein n=1 Tax=Kribbella qitaiheensis TaxID=1544730 RepID=UPI001FE5384D|nr:GAF and ANTAR domain-containing protein [Kribbella qitaiheensis]
MLADQRGDLHFMASSDEQAELLELFELEHSQGPCVDCFRTGQPVVNVDLTAGRWPQFAAAALAAGYGAAHALPLRLRGEVIGAMNLFSTGTAALTAEDLKLGQALADMATIGLLHERAVREREVLAEQLQHALNSRILIEQAKGMLAERAGLPLGEAFAAMRSYARSNSQTLTAVANAIIGGSLDKAAILAH